MVGGCMQDQPRRDSTLKTKKWAKAPSPANLSAPASVIELESSNRVSYRVGKRAFGGSEFYCA